MRRLLFVAALFGVLGMAALLGVSMTGIAFLNCGFLFFCSAYAEASGKTRQRTPRPLHASTQAIAGIGMSIAAAGQFIDRDAIVDALLSYGGFGIFICAMLAPVLVLRLRNESPVHPPSTQ